MCSDATEVISDGDCEGIAADEIRIGCVGPCTSGWINGCRAVGCFSSGLNGVVVAVGESVSVGGEKVACDGPIIFLPCFSCGSVDDGWIIINVGDI